MAIRFRYAKVFFSIMHDEVLLLTLGARVTARVVTQKINVSDTAVEQATAYKGTVAEVAILC